MSYFDPVKAIDLTCEAVRMLVDKGYDIVFDLVGDGPGRKLVEAAVDRLGLRDRVFFHGFVPQGELMTEYSRNADIFVLSSNSEGSPRTLNEAMARCVPVIATDVGGVPDILKDGELGLLVPPKDSGSIADAIEKLIMDGKLRRRYIRLGYEDTKKHTLELFTKERVEHMLRHHANAKRAAR